MIFSVQRFLEDYFERRGFQDVDQYAIRVANVFERLSPSATAEALTQALAKVRTAFYRRNRQLVRGDFEAHLAASLRGRFKKKEHDPAVAVFEAALGPARSRLRGKRRSISVLLSEFKRAVESLAV